MKNLFTLLFLFVFTLSFSQVDTIPIVEETITKTETTFDKVYSDIKEGLKGLGEALKVGSEHVYTVLVKQQVIKSITFLVIFFISLLGLMNFFKAYKSDEKWITEDEEYPNGLGVFRVVLGAAFFIGFMVSLCQTELVLTGLLNPEYGAMQDIVKFIK
jgi:hypothetical protein